jgi:hypothetical protein
MLCCRYFKLQTWFDVDFLDFYIERILSFFGLATVLATFSKNWAVFIQSSDHTEHWLAYFATVVSYGRKFLTFVKRVCPSKLFKAVNYCNILSLCIYHTVIKFHPSLMFVVKAEACLRGASSEKPDLVCKY